MSSEENYLDNLLNNVLEPKPTEPMKEIQMSDIETVTEPSAETNAELAIQDVQDEFDISEIEELDPEPDIQETNMRENELELEELEITNIGSEVQESNPSELEDEELELPELEPELPVLEELELSDLEPETSEPELLERETENSASEMFELEEELEIPDLESENLESDLQELEAEELEISEIEPEVQETNVRENELELEALHTEIPEKDTHLDIEMPDTDKEWSLEDNKMPEDDELKLEDIELPELEDELPLEDSELDIDGLDEAIQSETELEMAGELNIDELDFGDKTAKADSFDVEIPDLEMPDIPDSEDFDLNIDDAAAFPELSDAAELLRENAKANESEASIGMEDNLEDVLNMLDDDAELAEINDMLKKSDNNEPIQDDMMDLLHQMADDEAASVNAGINHVDDDDDGVPLPELPQSALKAEQAGKTATADDTTVDDGKKKGRKASAKKSKGGKEAAESDEPKKPGFFGKFFHMLTEDLVPEPTEEELAAEKEAKAAKKQEEKAKKEEEKLANDETKKAKDEEKEAAKKAKQEAAAQKKKEKQAEKEKKAAAKRAKLEAEGPKKRIPPKKMAVGAVFGATVGGAVIIATNTLATQGFLQSARNAYIAEDYKSVYQLMYDMDFDETSSEGRIKAKSEVLLKMQRRYDSYQTNMKMGREVEALDALLQGITTYDTVNADAEKYEVMEEVDAIKAQILEILQTNYNLDETAARVLISNEDALSYTIALNDVINGN
ncbi:MAG: hypothetical protein HFH78_00285 [Lachnospiraceae bacterium]|nr:hypothetical protein [Lachnospiraceae bacterium]